MFKRDDKLRVYGVESLRLDFTGNCKQHLSFFLYLRILLQEFTDEHAHGFLCMEEGLGTDLDLIENQR